MKTIIKDNYIISALTVAGAIASALPRIIPKWAKAPILPRGREGEQNSKFKIKIEKIAALRR